MKPSIFSALPAGNGPQQYLHSARMFRDAAMRLPDYSNDEQYWPKYALLTHAIELSLKAFAQHSVENGMPPGEEPKQHDLLGWYLLALEYGLPDAPGVKDNIDILNQLHLNGSGPVPEASVIADSTVDHLIFAFTQSINPR
jgi:hypothetical protein